MIIQKIDENKDKKPNSREMDKLKEEFPQFFSKEGEFKQDIFNEFLAEEEIKIVKEGYELKFLGKSYAKYLSALQTETFISPDSKHNAQAQNTKSQNLYIVGDNLDALKHLLGSYANKIKCIYIDPPYNTGSDGFVYPDNFKFDVAKLAETIGITEEEAGRILSLAGKSTHSAWLSFIYPRLILARELLSDDGVIFISIDDNEQANLKLACDEIFGEENFVGNISRATGTTTGQDANKIGSSLDYCCVYSKSNKFELMGVPLSNDDLKRFKKEDELGLYSTLQLRKTGTEDRKEDRENMFYPVTSPDGDIVYPFGPTNYLSRWRVSFDSYKKLVEDNMIEWEKREIEKVEVKGFKKSPWVPYVKYYADGRTKQISNLFDKIDGNKKASLEVKELFLEKDIFNNPKPTSFIKLLLTASTKKDSIILDFFSGSATTADAVMQLNAKDGGTRKYIMVQIAEAIDKNKPAFKAGYKTIDEIGRERIKRAAKKIQAETNAEIDYGYKLFYLQTPTTKTLIDLENFEPQIKLIADDMVSIFDTKYASGKDNILASWLCEDGYGLSKSATPYKLDEYEANLIEKSLYIIDAGLSSKDAMKLIKDIESGELDITRIVIYAHSLTFIVLQELRKNLKVLRNNKNVTLIERF